MSLIAIVALDDFFHKRSVLANPAVGFAFQYSNSFRSFASEEEIPKSPVERRVPLVE